MHQRLKHLCDIIILLTLFFVCLNQICESTFGEKCERFKMVFKQNHPSECGFENFKLFCLDDLHACRLSVFLLLKTTLSSWYTSSFIRASQVSAIHRITAMRNAKENEYNWYTNYKKWIKEKALHEMLLWLWLHFNAIIRYIQKWTWRFRKRRRRCSR